MSKHSVTIDNTAMNLCIHFYPELPFFLGVTFSDGSLLVLRLGAFWRFFMEINSFINLYSHIKNTWVLGIPWWSSGLDSELPLQGVWVQPLVGELRSCMTHSTAPQQRITHTQVPRKYCFKNNYLLPDANKKTCNNTLEGRRRFLHYYRVYQKKKCLHSVSKKLTAWG